MRLMAPVLAVVILSAVASASLYGWVDTNRPQIGLSEALKLGDKLLGDKRNGYYCVKAHLYGNIEGDGKGGAWSLLYGANDGSRLHVSVNMDGASDIQVWNGPIDWNVNAGRRKDLRDVESRLSAVLKSENLDADGIEWQDSSFTLSRRTRDFSVHTQHEDGTYSDIVNTVSGPQSDGIWIHARLAEQQPPKRPFRWAGPYWNLSEQNYLLAEGTGFLVVEMRYGQNFPTGVLQKLDQVFGERVP